ncbi:pentapeptide repeat-containing protein [Campylobacter jejuni]|nr:pentapeptide repeat-containing protein [Campylobacter jejuni]BEK27106.1 pentapeptide repeat-containing protein [Campylobacter jejuni]
MEDLVSNFLSEKNIDSEITFEKYIMSKTMLNNEKQYSVKDICCFNANNDNFKQHYDENKILEIHLNNMVFEEDLSFDNVKKLSLIIDDNVKFQRLCIFGCNELSLRINGRVKIIDKISINDCKFKQISINNHIDGDIEFQKCEFNNFNLYGFSNATIKGAFTFDFCEVKEKVNFMNFEFENKVSFKMSKFKDNVYFNNSVFKDYADFHECEFEKIACFYGVRFEKVPNFSQVIFKGNLNVVNTNLNFTFDDLQEKIKQEYASYETQRTAKEAGVIPNLYQEKSFDKFANDFRDSFKTFKNALIKDNNLLDASNFHKYELYCKEIELKQNWDKKGENVKNTTDLEKNVSRIRDFMDFLLLGFYRKLCDHHTDFLKVFNNLILLIALYALLVFGFTWLHDDKLEDTRAILTLFGFFDKFRLYFDIISTIFVVFGCGFFVCKLDSYEKKNNVSKKQNINFIYIIGDFLNLIKSLLFASFIPCVFYVLFLLFGFFLNLGKDFGYSLLINTLFVSLYICLVYTKSLFFGRYVVLIFSYIGFIIILIKQPNVIHPLIGKIANESDKFFNYPSLIVLNILYIILLALVLFSLQKTARKNSIVPS